MNCTLSSFDDADKRIFADEYKLVEIETIVFEAGVGEDDIATEVLAKLTTSPRLAIPTLEVPAPAILTLIFPKL